ncbi:YfjI family protein [Burkholderia sp. 3C]
MSNIFESHADRQMQSLPFPDYEIATDFPLIALPEVIQAAVMEICNRDKVAVPIAVQATLAAVSVACQDLVMVDRGFGELSVCSLFMLVVAESGARKTRADKTVTPIIEACDKRAKDDYEQKKISYELELRGRKDKEQGLRRALMTFMRKAHGVSAEKDIVSDEGVARIEAMLYELRSKPFENPKPNFRRRLYSDISVRELEKSLCNNWPAAGLISNEAADFLNSRNISDMARLDRLWDGQGIDVVGRVPRESFSVADPRLTMSLMIQPSVFDEFIEKKGERAKEVGFIPRMLIARPETSYGTRTANISGSYSTKWIDAFNNRVKGFLDLGDSDIEGRAGYRLRLHFSPAAQRLWAQEHDEKERGMADGGAYVNEREFVSRYSEHVARIAALFHFFNNAKIPTKGQDNARVDVSNEIEGRTLACAIEVVDWYLGEFSKIFNPDKSIKEVARYVYKKLLARIAGNNGGVVPGVETFGDENIKIRVNELREFARNMG